MRNKGCIEAPGTEIVEHMFSWHRWPLHAKTAWYTEAETLSTPSVSSMDTERHGQTCQVGTLTIASGTEQHSAAASYFAFSGCAGHLGLADFHLRFS